MSSAADNLRWETMKALKNSTKGKITFDPNWLDRGEHILAGYVDPVSLFWNSELMLKHLIPPPPPETPSLGFVGSNGTVPSISNKQLNISATKESEQAASDGLNLGSPLEESRTPPSLPTLSPLSLKHCEMNGRILAFEEELREKAKVAIRMRLHRLRIKLASEQQHVREAELERQRQTEGRERLNDLKNIQEEILQLNQLQIPSTYITEHLLAGSLSSYTTRGNQLCSQVSEVVRKTAEGEFPGVEDMIVAKQALHNLKTLIQQMQEEAVNAQKEKNNRAEKEEHRKQVALQEQKEAEKKAAEEEHRKQVALQEQKEAEKKAAEEEEHRKQVALQEQKEAEKKAAEEEEHRKQVALQEQKEAEKKAAEEEHRKQVTLQEQKEAEKKAAEEEEHRKQVALQEQKEAEKKAAESSKEKTQRKGLQNSADESTLEWFRDLQTSAAQCVQSFEHLVSSQDKQTKQTRMVLQKAATIPVCQISSESGSRLREIFDKIDNLLSGGSTECGGKSVSTSHHPQGLDFASYKMAETFVRLGDAEVASHHKMAFPIAVVASGIWELHPQVGDLILAHLHKACPFSIPHYPSMMDGMTVEEYKELLGYRVNESGVENPDVFLKRMSGMIRLYAAILQLKWPFGSKQEPVPHGLNHGWRWLAQMLNMAPVADITATLLYVFLEVCGNALMNQYQNQFWKLILLLKEEYLPRIEAVTSPEQMGSVSRLKDFIEASLQTKQIDPPESHLTSSFWRS